MINRGIKFSGVLASMSLVLLLTSCAGEEQEQSTTGKSEGSVNVGWTPPSQRSDGSALNLGEISGYRVYYGKQAGTYPNKVNVSGSNSTQVKITSERGFYYFVVTTVDVDGRESALSPPVQAQI